MVDISEQMPEKWVNDWPPDHVRVGLAVNGLPQGISAVDGIDKILQLIEQYPVTFGALATLLAALIGLIAVNIRGGARHEIKNEHSGNKIYDIKGVKFEGDGFGGGFEFVLRCDGKFYYFVNKRNSLTIDGKFAATGVAVGDTVEFKFYSDFLGNSFRHFFLRKKNDFFFVAPLYLFVDGVEVPITVDVI